MSELIFPVEYSFIWLSCLQHADLELCDGNLSLLQDASFIPCINAELRASSDLIYNEIFHL